MPYAGSLKDEQNTYLGTITFPSKKMTVSDPCYKKGTWCMLEDEPVDEGPWHVYVVTSDEGDWGRRSARIVLTKEKGEMSADFGKKLKADIGVDSGQAGIFDSDSYFNHEAAVPPFSDIIKPNDEHDRWYAMCCHRSLAKPGFGLTPNGVVSASGFGDGSYRLWKLEKNGFVQQWTLVFIESADDED